MAVTELELLEHVLAAPDDDQPRLVFADWLAERGDPRGELIHLQCALASMIAGDPRHAAVAAREQQLLVEHREAWAAPYRKWNAQVFFRRGFVDEIAIIASVFGRDATAITQLTPLRVVHGQGIQDVNDVRSFAGALRGIREVRVSTKRHGALTPRQVAMLVDSPHVAGLEALHMGGCVLGEPGLSAFLASSQLASLASLDLTNNGIEDRGAIRLAQTTTLPKVRRLALGSNAKITLAAFLHEGDALAEGLVELGLGRTRKDQGGPTALIASRALRNLRRLDLSDTAISDRYVEALVAWLADSELDELDLRRNRITDRGGRALLSCRPLRRLWLEGNAIDPALLAEVAERHAVRP